MARAFEPLRHREPLGHLATGMRTHRGIGDHSIGGALPRRGVEIGGIEAQQQNLVEPTAVAHDLVGRVHRPHENLRTAERQVGGFQRHRIASPDFDQHITRLRADTLGVVLRGAHPRCCEKGKSEPQRSPPYDAFPARAMAASPQLRFLPFGRAGSL